MPAIFTGFRISAGLAVIGAVVGELFFRQGGKGIGIVMDAVPVAQPVHATRTARCCSSSLLGIAVFFLFGWLAKLVIGQLARIHRAGRLTRGRPRLHHPSPARTGGTHDTHTIPPTAGAPASPVVLAARSRSWPLRRRRHRRRPATPADRGAGTTAPSGRRARPPRHGGPRLARHTTDGGAGTERRRRIAGGGGASTSPASARRPSSSRPTGTRRPSTAGCTR